MAKTLIPNPAVLRVDTAIPEGDRITLVASAKQTTAPCPDCGKAATRVHSRYQRTVADLPWQGIAVRFRLTVRKFFCDNRDCSRRLFAERFPEVVHRYARKTVRLVDALTELAFLVGGEAAARIAKTFGLLISPDTLLKAIKKAPTPTFATPNILGVDDFAFKKGHTYGTILIDQERRCPVDLLPDRNAESVATWLKQHPGIHIVTRDRATEYSKGITDGAPEATQVADRFHLLVNLREALERTVDRHRHNLTGIVLPRTGSEPTNRPRAPAPRCEAERTQQTHRKERRTRQHQQIHGLQEQGISIRGIARQLGITRSTVYRYLRLEEGAATERTHCSHSMLDAYLPYLCERFEQGCHNGVQLWREIKEKGFPGSRKMVAAWIAQQRTKQTPLSARQRTSSSRQIAWFLLRSTETRTPTEQAIVCRIEELCPDLAQAGSLARDFGSLVRRHQEERLSAWVSAASESGVSEMNHFAVGLSQDEDAVRAALSESWSNGPVEGQVNRLKFIKRSMYGRGSFALLRARVLHQVAK